MNAEEQNVEQVKPKSKRLSSLVWILVLWGAVRLYSELHPIYWTHLFFGVAIDSGLFPATLALFFSMWARNARGERILRWTAFGIIVVVLFLGILLQAMAIPNFRMICIVVHWLLLLFGVWGVYSYTAKRGETHEH